MAPPFPTPKFVTGGCLCGQIRYRVDFPAHHDFEASSGTCQCTLCRRQSGSLFFAYHQLAPATTSFTFVTPSTATTAPGSAPVPNSNNSTPIPDLKNPTALLTYLADHTNPHSERGVCRACGSWLYWRNRAHDVLALAVGTVDPLFLFGEGADGVDVPLEGYGRALVNGGGGHYFVENAIRGVTDRRGRGKRPRRGG
ncbi:putative glutathione-dependent formaldehyde-activating enzyme [Staphylotrichum tortipilum]|uniref:Glutathione-dependent formaldehyde-activating enzyme n=1 Tax=Staphylotrichum tortipilum TaxID=2831512 RepID=A0AAN6MTI8_9PEZI|nr:putative glutathione-dependent formaldehyde-activating enzyme [Staphylotrichum longicolle]